VTIISSVMARAKSSLILVGLLLIVLPLLAVLQYRWIGEVSAAERDRLESSLRVASDRFAMDFESELSRLANTFQIRDGFPETGVPIAERYQAWSEGNPYGRLVRAIYLLKINSSTEPEFYKADLENRALEKAELPQELEFIREGVRRGPTQYSAGNAMMLVMPIFRSGRQFGVPRPDEFRPRPRSAPDRPFDRGRWSGREEPPDRGPGPGGPGPGPGGPIDGAVVIDLNRDVILKEFVPALAEKHFASHDATAYRIAIVVPGKAPNVLYSSAGQWTPEDLEVPDAAVNLFNVPRPSGFGGRGPGGPRGVFQGSVISQPWQLVIKHRAGSLEKAVEQVRTRNMGIAFGILLVLSAGLITLVVSSQRAHTLGKLQMEFAAGVSHELRTPLAVIRSAAHNLRSGIVHDKEGVEEYAAIVQEEARRLSEMVEEVLLYSETQSGRKKYKLEPLDINDVVDRALTNLAPTIDLTNCELATHIDPDLPPVKADPAALAQCVQNLLSNAFKYGRNKDNVKIDIEARTHRASREVRLSVTDYGRGIDSADQRQLFEAFYRGKNAGANVPGNGLGLHLVKRIMQAQGGRVTYSPAPHGGASFTLHIPATS
jgi:signal transduction histidine kinase